MKEEKDYIRDIAEMRSLMERSSKFLSLSGLAGVMAGIYALAGAYIAYQFLGFGTVDRYISEAVPIGSLILLAAAVLVLTLATAVFLSYKNAGRRRERFWNASTRHLVSAMAVPLITGGLLILICIDKGMPGFMAPLSLIFYGIALFNASKFTYKEIRSLGLIEIILGLIGMYAETYGLLLWASGFGLLHIVYGIYMHYRYER